MKKNQQQQKTQQKKIQQKNPNKLTQGPKQDS